MRDGMRVLIMCGALIVLGASAASAAATPAQRCQSAKNQEAGRYAACLAKAEAKLLLTAGTCSVTTATVCFGDGDCPMGESCSKPLTYYDPAVTKCGRNFTVRWDGQTQKASDAGDPCPDGLEATEIQDAIDQHAANIAAALAGEGLGTCSGDLSACEDDLTTCETDLAMTQVGTATAAQVLSGQTFSSAAGTGLSGTMPNQGAVNLTPGTTAQTIAAGYHNGSGTVAGDADLVASNIVSGAEVFGVAGTTEPASGAATAEQVLSGVTYSNASGAGTGTMPNHGAVNLTPGTTAQTIAAGYHDGSGTVAGDADLVASNIVSGAEVFGVAGTTEPASGAATAEQVLSGVTYSNASGAGTGTMPNQGAVNLTPGTTAQTIAAGYHDGSGTVAGDADLVASNIVSGVNLFGVAGTVMVAQRLKTGQTQCWDASGTAISCAGTGQDGEQLKGVTTSFTDNGNGTISDNRTGLMWERHNDGGGINDKDARFTWTNAFNKVKVLNGDAAGCIGSGNPSACCTGAGTGSCTAFAGYTDWRLPNMNELQSLVNYGTVNPATHAAFRSSCPTSCTTCSCTLSSHYWSSTGDNGSPSTAWYVHFNVGSTGSNSKGINSIYCVRAVRGGS